MADGFSVTVGTAAIIAAMTSFPDRVAKYLKPAAKVTAERIASEARGRVARRTGQTAAGITVDETHAGDGYVVFAANRRKPGLPGWLEWGTRFMAARPFLLNSARLEEGSHLRRVQEAVQSAIDESGLGE